VGQGHIVTSARKRRAQSDIMRSGAVPVALIYLQIRAAVFGRACPRSPCPQNPLQSVKNADRHLSGLAADFDLVDQ
jgi:hypothetical protein